MRLTLKRRERANRDRSAPGADLDSGAEPAGDTDPNASEPEDDGELFRRAFADVRPLRTAPRVQVERPPLKPRPLQREKDERAVLDELLHLPPPEDGLETGEELLFLRSGYQQRYLRRLRRGHYAIRDELDLHGMNEAAARHVLLEFLQQALERRLGCVKVVHGKGLRSRGKPKLKALVNRLLRRHPAVVAFASCRPANGGTGAVAVLLKNRAR
jgi:DNA-nicking Smr family endonuclease